MDVLLAAGANPNLAARVKGTNPLHPLVLTLYIQNEDLAVKLAERLVALRHSRRLQTRNDSPFSIEL